MEPDVPQAELRAVATRPARGPLKNFFGDLRGLLRYGTLKATVQEFVRDDALGLAAHAAVHRSVPVLLFSLEMGHLEITQRLLCAEAMVDASRLRNGRLLESDWPRITAAATTTMAGSTSTRANDRSRDAAEPILCRDRLGTT